MAYRLPDLTRQRRQLFYQVAMRLLGVEYYSVLLVRLLPGTPPQNKVDEGICHWRNHRRPLDWGYTLSVSVVCNKSSCITPKVLRDHPRGSLYRARLGATLASLAFSSH